MSVRGYGQPSILLANHEREILTSRDLSEHSIETFRICLVAVVDSGAHLLWAVSIVVLNYGPPVIRAHFCYMLTRNGMST